MKTIQEEFAEVCGDTWHPPHVTDDQSSEGHQVFEWWKGSRSLTFYTDGLYLLRVWGPNIHDEMEDFELNTAQDFLEHWQWLRNARG